MPLLGDSLDPVSPRAGADERSRGGGILQKLDLPGGLSRVDSGPGQRREVPLGEEAAHGHLVVRAPASASSSRSRSRYRPYSLPFIARAASRTPSDPMVPIR